jgi:23S rRNA pseudouridine1911/1915/1917 synthase
MSSAAVPEPIELTVGAGDAGLRLDTYLARELPQYSRVQWRKVIGAGGVRVDDAGTKVAYRLEPGQRIVIRILPLRTAGPNPENIPLEILYEDEHLVAVNKPPAMVVHPARGHWSGTLASALAWHFDQLSAVGGETRPGIVHRLDRDTSGVILVAKSDQIHNALADQFAARTTEKEYFALVAGTPDRDSDWIDQPIAPHPHHREKMAIRANHELSRDAKTLYQVAERFDGYAAVRAFPKTGRTHQIRVHLAHIGHPVLCDRLYGGRAQITRGKLRRELSDGTVLLDRQALHARRIKITHPVTGDPLEVMAPLPADIEGTLAALREFRGRR